MKKLYYTITTLEPLIITQHSDDPNMYETMEYIRGTIIQGVFAQNYLWKKNLKKADLEFTRLIVRGGCSFSNAYPIAKNKTFYPTPISVVREKYNTSKVHDLMSGETEEQTKGISSLVSILSDKVFPLTIRKEIRLHNQIDDIKRTSEEGILFNYQSLAEGMKFGGHITIVEEKDANSIKELIASGKEIRMGRSSTSEYGKVRFDWVSDEKEEKIQLTGNVILTLLSDTIIFNEDGFASLDIKFLKGYLDGVEIINSISRKSHIEGFLNVWKLRKPSENVFAAGSSFKLDKLPDNAEQLVNFGLGERTHEGYGQISFSIQNVKLDEYIYQDPENITITKPSTIPELTKAILHSAYLQRQKEIVTRIAIENAEKTNPGITNHLIGKLKGIAQIPTTLTANITQLRKPAMDQLKKSHLGNSNLLEHLSLIVDGSISICDFQIPIENISIDLSGSKTELTQLYFEQYFNQLRRKNKKQDERHARR